MNPDKSIEAVDERTGEVTEARLDRETYTVRDVKEQVNLIQQIMEGVMQQGEHYGKIPGCGDKDVLLKAGAEKLCLTFRMAPEYTVEMIPLDKGHREYRIGCRLMHIISGRFLGAGMGSCSTMEKKYRYRWETDRKTGSKTKVENEDIADTYNTVLKMAKKRALVDAVLTATAASDIFTQDLEDMELYAPPAIQKPQPKVPEAPAVVHEATVVTKEVDLARAALAAQAPARMTQTEIETAMRPPESKFFQSLHVAVRKAGISDAKMKSAIKVLYGKESSKDLTDEQCASLIKTIEKGGIR